MLWKVVFLVWLIFLLNGCSGDSDSSAPGSAGETAILPEAGCRVEKDWLNLDYEVWPDFPNPDVQTDFFLLVYSHSPSFCERQRKKHRSWQVPFQCGSPNRFGWVIHGLWGQSENAYVARSRNGHPRFCRGDLEMLPLEQLLPYLCQMPGTRLLQGEWEKHGACDFATPEEYFETIRKLSSRFRLPPSRLRARKAIQWMKANNPQLTGVWLHRSGDEFGICFDRELQVISCPGKR